MTDVLGKVTSGEADAGLVYVTDVIAAGDEVRGIEFPESASAVNDYPIATVADSENADLAQEFVDLVLGDDGQQVLADAGFGRALTRHLTWPGYARRRRSRLDLCSRPWREQRSCCSRWSPWSRGSSGAASSS